ncbi:MAG: DUF3604 domain-containing protein [Parachlamydiales bacterium]|nr:DUF3604 domain-containing protein [Parachlamydiales bacterium]
MRRSICLCEPHSALAGETSTWKFVFTTANSIPKGARLKFDLLSKGRTMDWEVPSTDIKKATSVIWAFIDPAKPISAKAVETADSIVPQYEFALPSELKPGQSFTVVLGAPPKGTGGSTCQTAIQRRRQFYLYIDPKANGKYEDPEMFSMDIRGNRLHAIRIIAPSIVTKNKRFDIIVRFEDEFGNLTNNAPEGTLIELSHEHLRENLNWKLFVPETGFVTLPNLYFNEEGVYRIQLRNMRTGEIFSSSPIKCFNEYPKQLFWGMLHGESERVDSTDNIESCLRHFRDEKAFNFMATSPFDSAEETPNEIWKLISGHVTEFNEDERFTAFCGFQWTGESPSEGTRQFLYLKDGKPLMRQKEVKSNVLKKIYKSISFKEAIAIPTFTAAKGFDYDYSDFTEEFERVVEIYNAWGSSECLEKEGNPRPIASTGKKGVGMVAEGTIQSALARNCRFGFVAGGYDDRGIYDNFFDSDQIQYSPGMTAIFAADHTRESMMDALYQRSCYATTGPRIVLGLFLAGNPMGSILDTKTKPGLSINRHISGFVAGTAPIRTIEIIRNGQVIKTFSKMDASCDFAYDESDEMKKYVFDGGKEKPPFLYYYVRVTQEDNHIAWSSPIWVDYYGDLLSSAPKKTKKVTKK